MSNEKETSKEEVNEEDEVIELPSSDENPLLERLASIEAELKRLGVQQSYYSTEEERLGTYDLAVDQKGTEIANALRQQNEILEELVEAVKN